jgi:hypothetical protein
MRRAPNAEDLADKPGDCRAVLYSLRSPRRTNFDGVGSGMGMVSSCN